jgi:hypothetical protein
MISQQKMNATACLERLTLKPHKEIHHTPRFGATIQKITGADEMGIPATPGQVIVNDARILQGRDQGIVGTVNVPHRHDSVDIREMPLVGLYIRRAQNQADQQGSNAWFHGKVDGTFHPVTIPSKNEHLKL